LIICLFEMMRRLG